MDDNKNLLELLPYIDPGSLNYTEWVQVGMALKQEGYTAADWESWSARDGSRYHVGECFKKWNSFQGSEKPVAAGTLVDMAKRGGWVPAGSGDDMEIGWDAVIGGSRDEKVIVDKSWVEGQEVVVPDRWDPVRQIVTYLETLFDSTENVGYVTESWWNQEKEKFMPTKGACDRTAGDLIERLNKCSGNIGNVIGDYNQECGAWIRFNPLDGNGVKNANVTDFRFALVESDNMDIAKQNEIIRALELPVACLVHSGGKSLHAIVRIDAADYNEYRKRVDYLYDVCKKNGLDVDTQNKNPARLSRMPGIMRKGKKQYLVDTNIGKANFTEWKEWIEAVNDDLPDPESMEDAWDNLPELAPPLINNVLRQGHKMLLAGPSKAGKSFALIEMSISIAEGTQWLSWECTRGRVMYVNLELDRASCLHRFRDVYNAMGLKPEHLNNIDIWNLRGKSVPMDKLAPKLIRRAAKKNYIAIIIDPIYKVITGDENSADQMANFCNQFDKVCTELGCAVIYCHHHSKGSQGGKRSMDRASGSGVFARDPDALLDLIELDITDELKKQEENKAVCAACVNYLNTNYPKWEEDLSQDDQYSEKAMLDYCHSKLSADSYVDLINKHIYPARQRVGQRTAWRIDGTLREFPKFDAVNLWFDYPVHHIDSVGSLKDLEADDESPSWRRNFGKKKSSADNKRDRKKSVESTFSAVKSFDENVAVTVKAMAEYTGVTEKTIKNHIKEHGGFAITNTGEVIKK